MMLRALLAVAVLLALSNENLLGQGADPTEASAATRLACLRPSPLPSCRAFILTEFSLNYAEFGDQNSDEDHMQWDLGAMVNVSPTDALGMSFSFGAPDVGHWGATLRYRKWFVHNAAVEFSPGFVIAGGDYEVGRRLRLTADLSLVMEGFVGIFAHGESTREGGRIGAGARLTSWPGLVVGLVTYAILGSLPYT